MTKNKHVPLIWALDSLRDQLREVLETDELRHLEELRRVLKDKALSFEAEEALRRLEVQIG